MRYFTTEVREGSRAFLEVYVRENQEQPGQDKRPCVIICPGGAYVFCGDRDSEPNALAFLGEGFQACVLRYTIRESETEPPLHDEPMRDAAAAVRYVRTHAADLGVDPKKIILLGVSAGGHTASCAAVFWDDETHIPGGGDALGRPDGLVLCYPVITGGIYAHRQSIANLTGREECCPENDAYSVENFVRPDTCPAFLWQPAGDETVPSENAMLLAEALQKNHVPFELHLYTQGWHGIGLADAEVGSHFPHVASWYPLALNWLARMGLGPR